MGHDDVEESSTGRNCFVFFLRFLKVFTVIALLFNITSYVITVKAGVESKTTDDLEKAFLVLASAGYVFLSIILIVSEFDPAPVMKFVMVFHYWAGRGFGMLWMGILTINSAKQTSSTIAAGSGINKDVVSTIGLAAGWTLIGIGSLYILMSVLCLRKILGEKDTDLEVALLREDGDTGDTSRALKRSEDALLIANMAIALGLPVDRCKDDFGGKSGTKAAKEYLKRKQAASGTTNFVAPSTAPKEPAPWSGANTNTGGSTEMTTTTPSYGSTAVNVQNDEGGARRPGGNDDDDELERMYYASMNQEQAEA